ncbi:riboflavin kinase [Pseudoduganella namucuonensis]|uniref:riboflavin kinase n=1 Tax=Pseudoduganella namucuonensis TaxID=1035707 RepID=A0A1I7KYR8_9BURK|nr:riboflavin kinase [Pseudoduganella namucuonensis]SFV02590.1 riboflavin kinase / FMN adenylyltransferase [Pseudoduganella namucuonensis]
MKLPRTHQAAAGEPCLLVVSDFDGPHGAHRRLLARARARADADGLALAALLLAPGRQEGRSASNLRDAAMALRECGVEQLMIARAGSARARRIMAWPNVRQCMEADDEARMARSAQAVDAAVRAADFAAVQRLLERPLVVSGRVVHGRKLGRTLGFPTLNLRMPHGPRGLDGVYAVRVHGLAPSALPAVASVGIRPTVEDDGERLLEVHVLEPIAACYGKIVGVEFLKKLRDEVKLDGLEALEAAIGRDIIAASLYLG